MQNRIKKLNIERAELSYKISKLSKALMNPKRLNISTEHKNMMIVQKSHMLRYRDVLDHRLADLKGKESYDERVN